jgi:hypothetical protein
MAHHDVILPGYEEGRFPPRNIPGVDVVINGHIHRPLVDARPGRTLWITPGNISRVSRSDAARDHKPAVLRIDISEAGWTRRMITVPHEAFDQVFHEEMIATTADAGQSAFIRGLAELQARRTESGAGLIDFIQKNIAQFDGDVAAEVLSLAQEVTTDGSHQKHE